MYVCQLSMGLEKLKLILIKMNTVNAIKNWFICEVIYEMFHILNCRFEIK